MKARNDYSIPIMRDDVGILYKDSGGTCLQPDSGAQVSAISGHCWMAQLGGENAVPVDLWGSVADSDGTKGNGTDNTSSEQAAIEWSVRTGRRITHPASVSGHMRRVTAPLVVNGHAYIDGDYCQPYTDATGQMGTPGPGSWLYFDHPGQGIVIGGSAAARPSGVIIANLCTYRNQPIPPSSGVFKPYANDYDIVENGDDVTISNVLTLNPTSQLLVNGGRLTVDGLRGNPLTNGVHIDGAFDIPRLTNVHDWPFWATSNAAVSNWMRANLTGLYTARADGFMGHNLFFIATDTCWHIGTDGKNASTYSGLVEGLYCDDTGHRGVFLDGNGTGDIQIANYRFQGATDAAGAAVGSTGAAVDIEGSGHIKIVNAHGTLTRGPMWKVGAPYALLDLTNVTTESWSYGSTSNMPAYSNVESSSITISGNNFFGGVIPNNPVFYSTAGTISAQVPYDPRTGAIVQNSFLVTLTKGASYSLPPGSGLILVRDTTNGLVASYVLGGGSISVQAAAEYITGLSPSPGKVAIGWNGRLRRYVITNNKKEVTTFFLIWPGQFVVPDLGSGPNHGQ